MNLHHVKVIRNKACFGRGITRNFSCYGTGEMTHSHLKIYVLQSPTKPWTYGQSSHISSLHNKSKTNRPATTPTGCLTVTGKFFSWSLVSRRHHLPPVPCAVSWIPMDWSLKLRSFWDPILHLTNLTGLEGGKES